MSSDLSRIKILSDQLLLSRHSGTTIASKNTGQAAPKFKQTNNLKVEESKLSSKSNFLNGVKPLPVTQSRVSVCSNNQVPYKPNSIISD